MILKKSILVGLGVTFGLSTTGLVSQASSYTVQQGDTVSKIAQTYGTSINAIANENQLLNPNVIYVGEKLTIGEKETQQSTQTEQQPVEQSQQSQQVKQPVQQPQQNQSQEVSQNNNQNYSGGSDVSSVAQEMQSRTGVSASEWTQIIQRESNGEVNATNASSGAHGLFQSMHNPGNTVQSQINDAVQVYKSQGLSAWSETR